MPPRFNSGIIFYYYLREAGLDRIYFTSVRICRHCLFINFGEI